MSDNRALRQFLQMLKSSGVSHLPTVRLPVAPARGKRPVRRDSVQKVEQPQITPSAPKTPHRDSVTALPLLKETEALLAGSFASIEEKSDGLHKLSELVAGCTRCTELAESRRQTVFGVGNPDARIMFVGEAPGADEDRMGEPFVGAAGQLLNKIIEASGFKREDLYICNILRCRPPGNRNPHPQEAANCREYLDGQIKIVAPEYIVCWGTVAAQNLLGETRTVGKLRGQFLSHGKVKVLCTYHPSYLLRNPSAKKLVWADMKLLIEELGTNTD